VAALFVGIFIAMQVPIEVLNVMGGKLGLSEPWHYFWATGSLSSVLDNAPTYVVFFETSKAMSPELFLETVVRPDLLAGVSLGAVFMGAMTYIGNGPNFMVKAIAEQSHVRMPSFFGYMFKYSIPVLVPVFILITFIFLRPGGMYTEMAENAERVEKPVHVEEHAVPGHGEEPLTGIPGRKGHDPAAEPEPH
jgi:Na+/H+ antiporter NhaD/arsenite permease-like protein